MGRGDSTAKEDSKSRRTRKIVNYAISSDSDSESDDNYAISSESDSESDVRKKPAKKAIKTAVKLEPKRGTDIKSGSKRKRIKDEPLSYEISSDEFTSCDLPSKRWKAISDARKVKQELKDDAEASGSSGKAILIDSESESDSDVKPKKKSKKGNLSTHCISSSSDEDSSLAPPKKRLKQSPKASKAEKEPKTRTPIIRVRTDLFAPIVNLDEDVKPAASRRKQKQQKIEEPEVTEEPDEFEEPGEFANLDEFEESPDSEPENVDPVIPSTSNKKTQVKKTGPKLKNQASTLPWDPSEEIASQLDLNVDTAYTITQLFDNGNTIPFLARYRQHLIGDYDAEKLRHVKVLHEYLKKVQIRATAIVKKIEKSNKLPPEAKHSILNARSLEELEFLCAAFKTGDRNTKAEKARQRGLEPFATAVLEGSPSANFSELQKLIKKPELSCVDAVKEGVQHIIADVISKNKLILDELRKLQERAKIFIQSKEAKAKDTNTNGGTGSNREKRERNKYMNFFDFKCDIKYVKPHQVLAINRAEKSKYLSVKIVLPDEWLSIQLLKVCDNLWIRKSPNNFANDLIRASFKDAYDRLIAPFVKRRVRSELSRKAQEASVQVFATNLKHLLLTPPLKGKPVLAIDPGFSHGCKIVFLDKTGNLLHSEIISLSYGRKEVIERTTNQKNEYEEKHKLKKTRSLYPSDAKNLKDLMVQFNCDTIAIGNGKGCREIEESLTDLIGSNFFSPLDVRYVIVSEQGASIYSVSKEAKAEFPDLPPNLVSAVSIGRRLQDPLSELVKIEPRHLGVGMYQHDVNEKLLESTLNEVVIECVSFVGVDINTASIAVLRHIAGLNQQRAQAIIEWRKKNGTFTNRSLLKSVKQIGDKTFEQCAGFIRIIPQTAEAERPDSVKSAAMLKGYDKKLNPLDQTQIHPESYPVVHKLCKRFNVNIKDIGTDMFIRRVKSALNTMALKDSAELLEIDVKTMEVIVGGLTKPLNHDLRAEFSQPLFKKGLYSLDDINPGMTLTGRVENVLDFGAFVDIGVTVNGLIHISRYNDFQPALGNRVEVVVERVDRDRQRVELSLQRLIL